MLAMIRSFYIQQQDNPDHADLYEAIQNDLHTQIPGLSSRFISRLSEWRSEISPNLRLVQVRLDPTASGISWGGDIYVASKSKGAVVVFERWQIQTHLHDDELCDMPGPFEFVGKFNGKNEDGYLVGKSYSISADRIQAFV